MTKGAEWIASVARVAMIGIVVACALAGYGFGTLRRLAIRDRAARLQHRARQRGRLLRWTFAHLGATFIKVGQVMSSRPDLFSAGVIDELRWLQDRVPPFGFRQVRAIIERELGAPLELRFREFCAIPIAAGSVAQVHRAVLASGDEVAVKILRPGVLTSVRRDGRIMMWTAHVAHLVSPHARAADLVGHVRSLIAGILAQTDLRRERTNYEQFRRNFAGVPGIYFPIVNRAYSTRSMLTMELIHGVRLENAAHAHLPKAAEVIRTSFFAMCFDHGFVHADLHPGNVLIRDDGVVVAHVRAHPIAKLELSTVVGELFAIARKHGIRPMPEMSLVLLGMVTNEGMAKRLDPAADTLAELARFLGPRIGHRAKSPPRTRLARGSRSWLRSPIDAMRVTGARAKVIVGRPPGASRPARITARYLHALASDRKTH